MNETPGAHDHTTQGADHQQTVESGLSSLLDDLYNIGEQQDSVDDDLDLISQELEPAHQITLKRWSDESLASLQSAFADQPPEVQELILARARIPVRHQDNEDLLVSEATESARMERERRERGAKADDRRMNIVLWFAILVYATCFAASVYFFATGNPIAGSLFFGGPVLLFLGNAIAKILTKSGAQD